jgi:hypothetical protein
LQFGEQDIGSILLDPKSRDDIPQLLRGLQHYSACRIMPNLGVQAGDALAW